MMLCNQSSPRHTACCLCLFLGNQKKTLWSIFALAARCSGHSKEYHILLVDTFFLAKDKWPTFKSQPPTASAGNFLKTTGLPIYLFTLGLVPSTWLGSSTGCGVFFEFGKWNKLIHERLFSEPWSFWTRKIWLLYQQEYWQPLKVQSQGKAIDKFPVEAYTSPIDKIRSTPS